MSTLTSSLETSEIFSLMNETGAFVAKFNTDGFCHFLNPKWNEFTGVPIATPFPEAWWKPIHPEDADINKVFFEKQMANKEAFVSELRIQQKDGAYEWFNLKAFPNFNSDNTFIGYLVCCTNINEQKETKRKLIEKQQELVAAKEKAEQMTRELRESQKVAALGSWYLDLATENVSWSDELYTMYDLDPTLPPPTLTEQTRLFTEDSWKKLLAHIEKAATEGIPYELELEMNKGSAPNGWMWAKGEAVFDDNNTIVGLRGVAQDITQRKRLELDLKDAKFTVEENNNRLRVATDAAHLGIWDWHFETQHLEFDDRMFEMYGYHKDCEETTMDLWNNGAYEEDKDRVEQEVMDALAGIKPFNTEFRIQHPNGKVVHIRAKGIIVRDKANNPVRMIGVNQDITTTKTKELTLLAKNRQLVDFSNIVAHNLRAPLINLEMLANRIDITTQVQQQQLYLQKLKEVIGGLSEIFNELLETVQIRQDNEIQIERIDLKQHISKTLATFETQLKENNAQVDIDVTKAPVIYFPHTYLDSILTNLISNAIKYKSEERELKINIRASFSKNQVLLSVQDNGLGINMNLAKKHLFKIRKTFHQHPEAKGFGLFMIKTQIEAMGGEIWVESAPDLGSTFFVKFTNQNHENYQ